MRLARAAGRGATTIDVDACTGAPGALELGTVLPGVPFKAGLTWDRAYKITLASATTIDEGLATVYAVYQAAAKLTNEKYGSRALKADEGGLACAEITFRTAAAPEALRHMRDERPDMLLGAGTVLTLDQARAARDAGADFVVSPGSNPRVIDFCLENGIPVYPGVCTPTEIEAAIEKGLELVKFFPAEPMGGTRFLSAVASPYPMVSFMPTGGIGPANLGAYLALPNVLACGGSWMATGPWIEEGQFDRIRDEVASAVSLVSQSVP